MHNFLLYVSVAPGQHNSNNLYSSDQWLGGLEIDQVLN